MYIKAVVCRLLKISMERCDEKYRAIKYIFTFFFPNRHRHMIHDADNRVNLDITDFFYSFEST